MEHQYRVVGDLPFGEGCYHDNNLVSAPSIIEDSGGFAVAPEDLHQSSTSRLLSISTRTISELSLCRDDVFFPYPNVWSNEVVTREDHIFLSP